MPSDPKDDRDWERVEALSEARWGRIKRSLFDRLDEEAFAAPEPRVARLRRHARPLARLVVAGAAAAAVGALASRALWRAPSTATPSHIATATSESHVVLAGASIDVGPRSELDVSGDDEHGVRVHLDRGRVACEVAPRHGRPPFLVEAGDALVRVVGTRFAVSREDDGVHVEVSRGGVEVEARGEIHRVGAGESWLVAPRSVAVAPEVEPTSLPASSGTAAHVAPHVASLAVAPPVTRAAPSAVEVLAPASPTASPVPAVLPLTLPAPAIAPEPRRTPQTRYESAASLESTEPAAALAIYDDLAQGDGPWSANALFAEGRLQADRGARDVARRLLGQYLARFPHGPNAADARDLLEGLAHPKP